MKSIIVLFTLTISLIASAQEKKYATIAMPGRYITYRGINNPIKIAVPEAKSFTANGIVLDKVDDEGNYLLKVTTIYQDTVSVNIDIVLNDGQHKIEKQLFEVRDFRAPLIEFDDKLYSSGTVVGIERKRLKENSFEQVFPFSTSKENVFIREIIVYSDKWKQGILNQGNKFNSETLNKIAKLKDGSIVHIAIIYNVKGAENYKLPDLGISFIILKDK